MFASGHTAQLGRVGIVIAPSRRFPFCQPIGKLIGKDMGVFEGRALHPPARALIADDHADIVVVGAVLDFFGVQAELFAKQGNVRLFTRQKCPARFESFFVLIEGFGRIVVRINGDRVKENIRAQTIPQDCLHPHELCRFQWANVRAVGVDKVDRHDFIFDQVIAEVNRLAVVGYQRNIGEIVRTPRRGRNASRNLAREKQGGGGRPKKPVDCHFHRKTRT